MLLGVIDNIWDFFSKLTQNGLTKDLLFYISLGFIIFMVIFFMIKSRYAYEGRLERSLEKLNRWLYSHEQIDESNLVEFNRLIKTAPKLLRYHWQQYMLYREHAPSYYMSMYNCIEKPLHTSSYSANIKNFTGICATTMLVTFLLTLLNYGKTSLTVEAIAISLIAPAIIMIFSVVFIMLLRATQNFTLSSLYQNFHLFNRYVDKASTTIPKYVDFEILFTRKEIKGGIPVLNEYLEKRARQEAEELEKARQNAVEHEVYNFDKTGIDGSLILDRAMKESEIYLNYRQRLLAQIQQYESEIESLKRNYENTSKDYQRKLQASKENIERLRVQQEESTNRIEVNYIRKQQQDEIKKQEQLEKDQDSATVRFDQETSALREQIEKCRTELEEKKEYATNSMLSEYDTFATKVYKAIMNEVQEKHNEELNELNEQKEEAEKELLKVQEINNIKDSVINDLRELIHNQGEPQDLQDKDENKQENELKDNIVAQEAVEAPEEEIVEKEDKQAQEVVAEQVQSQEAPTQEPQDEKVAQEESEQTPEQQDVQGYYDDNGYYWFANGTYYDNHNYYHDENNDIYDQDGNYISPEEYERLTGEKVDSGSNVESQTAEEQAEKPVEQVQDTQMSNEQEQPTEQSLDQLTEQPAQEQIEQPVESPQEQQVEKVVEEQSAEEKQAQPVEEILKEEKPKGKRGRPRKNTTDEQQESKPKGKRGRPKKVETESNGEKQEQEKPKVGRGRPKKEKVENTDEKPKAGRGRPRKEKNESAEQKPKGKRGRPKKQVSDLNELSEQIANETDKLKQQQDELNRELDETLQHINAQQNDDKPDGEA